ncbi:MAG TPA: hypothetical protein EYP98_00560, partial [Planctomycetes bacterium]|nr:hypothetical protein [Planctomycetota bacterium]
TFDTDFMAKSYVQQTNLPWPLLIDSNRSVYESYGMGRGSWWSIYNPVSIWGYLKLIIFRRTGIHKPGSDYRQMGGDVLIDPQGLVRVCHASESPHDRPSVENLLAAAAAEAASSAAAAG